MNSKHTIEYIVKKHLCTGCGTCIGICPQNAINLQYITKSGIYLPKVEQKLCNNCGNCIQVCPGHPFTYAKLIAQKSKKIKYSSFLGPYKQTYIGHAQNEKIRYNSASGGLITQLLVYAFELRLIDGAIVTKMKENNPLLPEVFIARSKEEIIKASKSKYCPVPVNTIIREIIKAKDLKCIAQIGLPCQIEGMRLAEKKYKVLREKIKFHFGIFCSHTLNFHATSCLLNSLKIERDKITKFDYRGEGWPGKIKIHYDNNKVEVLSNDHPVWERIFHCGFFTPIRCVLCNDLTSEVADLSFGDAWLPEIIKKDKIGSSVVISRNEIGEKLLNQALLDKKIIIREVAPNKVIQSQKGYSFIKKINIYDRLNLHGLFYRMKYQNKKVSIRKTPNSKYLAFLMMISSYIGNTLGFLSQKLPIGVIRKVYLKFLSNLVRSASKLKIKSGINILILHAHWNNRGDESAVRAMIDSLKKELVINQIKIMIMVDDVKYFPYNDIEVIKQYPFIRPPYSIIDIISLILTKGRFDFPTLMDFLLITFTKGKIAFSDNGKRFLKHLEDSDVIIHAPGGPMFGENYAKYEIPYLLRLFIPILKKKPILLYAPSVGPFIDKYRNILRKFILKRVNLITLRDPESSQYLRRQLGINSLVTIDSALQNEIIFDSITKKESILSIIERIEKQKVIGITMTELRWHPRYKDNTLLRKRIHDSISEFIRYVIKKGYSVLIIPQIFGYDFEKAFLNSIHEIDTEKVLLLPEEVDSYAQQALISKLYCVIGMRYHPNIFAAKRGTPSIAISYEHKATAFMEKLGRSDLIINVIDINFKLMVKKFNYLVKNYDKIKEEIENNIEKFTRLSQRTTKMMKLQLKNLKLI